MNRRGMLCDVLLLLAVTFNALIQFVIDVQPRRTWWRSASFGGGISGCGHAGLRGDGKTDVGAPVARPVSLRVEPDFKTAKRPRPPLCGHTHNCSVNVGSAGLHAVLHSNISGTVGGGVWLAVCAVQACMGQRQADQAGPSSVCWPCSSMAVQGILKCTRGNCLQGSVLRPLLCALAVRRCAVGRAGKHGKLAFQTHCHWRYH